jgi:hypothetical protein
MIITLEQLRRAGVCEEQAPTAGYKQSGSDAIESLVKAFDAALEATK